MLLLDKNNGITLWVDTISKEITELEGIDVFQFYWPKNKLENKYGWQYAQMNIIFDANQKYLQHKARLVVGGHVVDCTKHTTYSSTVKDLSVRLMLFIVVKNGLGLIAG